MYPSRWPGVEFLGRLLLAAIFLLSGANKLKNWAGTEAQMEAHGMAAIPLLQGVAPGMTAVHVFLTAAVVIEILGGLMVLLGCGTRFAALVLFLYLIPVTLVFHNFWAYQGSEQQMQMINFLKNLAIMGGLLKYVAAGAGAWSVDARGRRAVPVVPAPWGQTPRPV